MNVRTNYGIKKVSDKYKKKLAKVKRDSGAEAITLMLNGNQIDVICAYTGVRFTMPIIK
jgi:hypothetical protein